MSGNSKLEWFEKGYQRGQLAGDQRAELALMRADICDLKATAAQILLRLSSTPASEPSDFWAWWARVQLRLGFIGTAYKAFRMVPWGLIFLACVAMWKAALRFFA